MNDLHFYFRERLDQDFPHSADTGTIKLDCPFCQTNGKTGIFNLNVTSDYWRCTGCLASGNSLNLEMRISGCTYNQAYDKVQQIASIGHKRYFEEHPSPEPLSSPCYSFDGFYQDEWGTDILKIKGGSDWFGPLPTEYAARVSGGWGTIKTSKVPGILYRLPSIISATTIFIVDSEFVAGAVAEAIKLKSLQGCAVTCWPEAVAVWPVEQSKYFHGKKVIVVPENTDTSRSRLETAANGLVGVARIVKLIPLPKGMDSVYDFCKMNHDSVDKLLADSEEAPLWKLSVEDVPFVVVNAADESENVYEGPEFLIDGLLLSTGFSIISGEKKHGKSVFVRGMVCSIADGNNCLGRKVKQNKVLYISREEESNFCKAHLKKLGTSNLGNVRLIGIEHGAPNLHQLRKYIETEQVGFIVFDTLFKSSSITAINDYVTVTNWLQPLHVMAHELRVQILGICHANQQGEILGSTAFGAATDQNFYIQKPADNRGIIWCEGRQGTSFPPMSLHFDPVQENYSLGKSLLEEKLEQVGQEMLAYIKNNPGTGQKEIFEAVEGRKTQKWDAFNLLKPKLEVAGSGKKSDPYQYFPKNHKTTGEYEPDSLDEGKAQ